MGDLTSDLVVLRERTQTNRERFDTTVFRLSAATQSVHLTRRQLATQRAIWKEAMAAFHALSRHRRERRERREPRRTVVGRESPEVLLARYAVSGDPAIRAELATAYDPLARTAAGSFRSRREAHEDLLQVARVGLLLAIDRFDPARGVPFPAFGRATINGELKRHLRDRTWSLRVPRGLQERYLEVMRSREELTAALGHSPSVPEVADRCGMSVEHVLEAMELASNRPLSLDWTAGDEAAPLEIPFEDPGFGRVERDDLLGSLIGRLSPVERELVRLRFAEGMSQAQIGDRFGVSQMWVSRKLASVLDRLRALARAS